MIFSQWFSSDPTLRCASILGETLLRFIRAGLLSVALALPLATVTAAQDQSAALEAQLLCEKISKANFLLLINGSDIGSLQGEHLKISGAEQIDFNLYSTFCKSDLFSGDPRVELQLSAYNSDVSHAVTIAVFSFLSREDRDVELNRKVENLAKNCKLCDARGDVVPLGANRMVFIVIE